MRCATARRRLTEVVLGEMSPRRRAAVTRHLDGCDECREEYRKTEALARALAAMPRGPLPARLEAETLGRIRALAADESRTRGWWPLRRWAGLALPALAAAAALLVTIRAERTAAPVPAELAGTTAALPRPGDAGDPPRQVARQARPRPPQVARSDGPTKPPAAPERGDPPAVVRPDLPDELLARPDLFVDLPILTQMEKLENYDAIVGVDLADEGRPNG